MTSRLRAGSARLLGALLALSALGSIAATVLATAAGYLWFFDLFAHFRVQYLVVQLLTLVPLALARSRVLASLVAASIVLNGYFVLPYAIPVSAASARGSGSEITLLTVNVAARNDDYERLFAAIARERPDVIVVEEFTPRWAERFASLPGYPHRVGLPLVGPFGIALLSRWPLAGAHTLELGATPAVTARVDAPSGPVRLVGVHLLPPISRAWSERRNSQLDAIAALLDRSDPVAVLGDFNLTPYSPRYRDWLARSGLRDTAAGRGLSFTWPTFMPLLGIPIDQCLVSADLGVVQRRRLPKFGSDHYPLLIRLARNGAS